MFIVVAKRKIVPFADPQDLTEGWKVDPSDRYQFRFWDGEVWTFHVLDDGVKGRDPPTKLSPANRFQ